MQEWLNWPAWKASKRQKRFRGSNPLLSANTANRQTVAFYATVFVLSGGREFIHRPPFKIKTEIANRGLPVCFICRDAAGRHGITARMCRNPIKEYKVFKVIKDTKVVRDKKHKVVKHIILFHLILFNFGCIFRICLLLLHQHTDKHGKCKFIPL